MDKYEYKVRSEEISNLIDKEKYTEAVNIADTIDWRRVKSAGMLLKIAALYRINRRNEDSREILMLAYDRHPTNRSVVYSLCELSIELDDVVAAIEYYKQFAKLAPKDNGVYTLRYRILEAQEASLEERIEILEELKKRDYQEEWAYELAYLYHRVGLSTKCVEECDDIILWFGDGPYVMKAMELKALHIPLTEVQQKKYEMMIELADNNYGEAEYQEENYQDQNYDGQEAYAEETYGNSTYGQEDYAEEAYGNEAYGQDNYAEQSYENEAYGQDNYTEETYGNETGSQDNYAEQSYGNEPAGQEGYTDQTYENDPYHQETYAEEYYGNETYGQEDYEEQSYESETYEQNGYVDDGYGNLSYVDSSYQENSLTGEFYVEQTYDVNGNPIDASGYGTNYENSDSIEAGYINSGYTEGDSTYENGSYNDANEDAYAYNENHNAAGADNIISIQKNNMTSSAGAGDMSQYNTINLQKVVAESMRELFPDDDIFAEDREKYNSQETVNNPAGDTRIYAGANNQNIISDIKSIPANNSVPAEDRQDIAENSEVLDKQMHRSDDMEVAEPSDIPAVPAETSEDADISVSGTDSADEGAAEQAYTQTGKIAQMVTSVSEAAPEPHTGAIKKVLIPGEDARFIKSESDLDELRDTTERTIVEEHSRMEYNDENVYREQSLTDMEAADDALENQASGSMNLDDVLVEWERMKLDNAKKHQEEIKQQILTQTGKILADFDNSIKSGILGELEREEAQAQKKDISSADGFLEADDTGDISQSQDTPVLEDDFDVSYVSEKAEKAETEKTEQEAKEEYLTELERVVAQELGGLTKDIPQETIAGSADDNLTEENGETDEIKEPVVSEKAEYDTESGAYTGENDQENMEYYEDEIYAQEDVSDNTEYYEDDEYGQETISSGTEYYENDEYTEESTAENTEYYEEGAVGQEEVPDNMEYYEDNAYAQETASDNMEYYGDMELEEYAEETSDRYHRQEQEYNTKELDPEDAESIAEMAKEDALKTQEIKMNTADLSSLSEKIVATTKKEAKGAKREEIRDFTQEEQTLFENFAVTKKIKKQIVFALDNITLAAYTGNIIITGDAGLDTVRMAKNLVKEYQASDANFSGKLAKITGEKFNQRNVKDVFEKLNNGGIIIEKANGMSEEKLYEMALNLNQENLGIVVIMEDTKKEITKLLEKQAMIADYFNIRIDLMEMDNNALVAYAKNYALALEYSIDELGTLALYTRIANMQSGNHVVTKDEVRDIIDEAIWKSKKSKIKNFVDVLFARRYDNEDMIVLKERDFM